MHVAVSMKNVTTGVILIIAFCWLPGRVDAQAPPAGALPRPASPAARKPASPAARKPAVPAARKPAVQARKKAAPTTRKHAGRAPRRPKVKRPGRRLSLRAAVNLAMRKSRDIKAADAQIREAQAKTKAARSRMLPTISVLGVVQVQAEHDLDILPQELKDTFQTLFPDLDPDSLKMTVAERWFAQLGVGVIQPLTSLYPLHKLFSIEKLGVKALRHSRAATRNKVKREVVRAYLQIYIAKQYLEIARQGQKLVAAHLNRVRKALAAEAVRKAELLQVQVKAAEMEHAVLKAGAAVKLAGANLNYKMGIPLATRIEPTERFADPPPPLKKTLARYKSTALKTRPELRMVRTRIRQAKLGRKAAWFQYVPVVALMAGYQFSHGLELAYPTNRWYVGGVLKWSWEWGRKKYVADQLTAKQRRAEHLLAKARQGIQLQIIKYHLDLVSSRKSLSVAKRAIKQAQERHRMEVRRYQLKAGTTTDLLDAQMALSKARVRYAHALYGYYMNLANLEEAVGGRL